MFFVECAFKRQSGASQFFLIFVVYMLMFYYDYEKVYIQTAKRIIDDSNDQLTVVISLGKHELYKWTI